VINLFIIVEVVLFGVLIVLLAATGRAVGRQHA
jgi:hypothetical protein